MQVKQTDIDELIWKYLQNKLTEAEKAELEAWISGSEPNRQLFVLLTSPASLYKKLKKFQAFEVHAETLQNKLNRANPPVITIRPQKWWIYRAAAVLFFLTFLAMYLTISPGTFKQRTEIQLFDKKESAPGGNKAVLVLADGSLIFLNSASNGILAQQGNTAIVKKDGELVYQPKMVKKKLAKNNLSFYNTVSTSKGEEYRIVLSDGSKVWLNSESSVRFPTMFSGSERRVEITGEVYFEVVTQKQSIPFIADIVTPSGLSGEVEVLGTHFNINAYRDEGSVKTTLLEGSVKLKIDGKSVKDPKQSVILKPGQQASTSDEPGEPNTIRVQTVDPEEEIAWKKGYFRFKGTDIKQVLKQIARWYDVEIVYEVNVPKVPIHITGQVSRDSSVSKVLELLEGTGSLHFKMEGKKIIVRL
jgi:transmembrane sensor